MKKTILSLALCIAMATTAAMAQDSNRRNNTQRRAPQQMDAVVDTTVLNKMELEPQLLTQILELQTTKQAEQKATLEAERTNRTADGKRQKLTDEEREARRQEQEAFKAGYRQELRTLMGDALYIAYLERLVDARGMMRTPVNRNNQNAGNQRGGDMPGGDMPGGGFGGGFGGGDF